jgi:UDP-N-acetylmuramoyl-tripeptide--D-alanyl-D-alanine ligase
MAAALAVLGKRKGRRIAVLGDMLELGECAPAEHHRVGVLAAQNADIVLAYGSNARYVAQGAAGEAAVYTDRNVMADSLRLQARPGDTILFKGSHGMHMELVLEAFLKEET